MLFSEFYTNDTFYLTLLKKEYNTTVQSKIALIAFNSFCMLLFSYFKFEHINHNA